MPAPPRADTLLADELPRLLKARGLSMRALARELGVDQGFLSRAIRKEDSKRISPHLLLRIAEHLAVEPGHFPELREIVALAVIKQSASARDAVYDSLPRAALRQHLAALRQ